MSKAAKLLQRLQEQPTDLTWEELKTLLASFGFELRTGKGSSRKFVHATSQVVLMMHQPHPGNLLKRYQVKAVLDLLKSEGYIE